MGSAYGDVFSDGPDQLRQRVRKKLPGPCVTITAARGRTKYVSVDARRDRR